MLRSDEQLFLRFYVLCLFKEKRFKGSTCAKSKIKSICALETLKQSRGSFSSWFSFISFTHTSLHGTNQQPRPDLYAVHVTPPHLCASVCLCVCVFFLIQFKIFNSRFLAQNSTINKINCRRRKKAPCVDLEFKSGQSWNESVRGVDGLNPCCFVTACQKFFCLKLKIFYCFQLPVFIFNKFSLIQEFSLSSLVHNLFYFHVFVQTAGRNERMNQQKLKLLFPVATAGISPRLTDVCCTSEGDQEAVVLERLFQLVKLLKDLKTM